MKVQKKRLRVTSSGWFFGIVYYPSAFHNDDSLPARTIWCGPYATPEEAFCGALSLHIGPLPAQRGVAA